jgi:hypothetical protein
MNPTPTNPTQPHAQEEWRTLTVAGSTLLVSSLGNVKLALGTPSKLTLVLTPIRNAQDQLAVRFLASDGTKLIRAVDVLVCTAFHGPPSLPWPCARHVNKNRNDNRAANLIWPLHVPIPVAQYTLDDVYVATYLSASAATVALRTPRHDKICECCKGLASKAGGFKWRFATPEQVEDAQKVLYDYLLLSISAPASHKRSRAEEDEERSSDSGAGSSGPTTPLPPSAVAPASVLAKRPRTVQDERMSIAHLL